MPEKPSRVAEYSKEQVQLVTATCLYIATILGDYMEQAVIVGGLVPSLLIDQKNLPNGRSGSYFPDWHSAFYPSHSFRRIQC
jgi:hypothetical protein